MSFKRLFQYKLLAFDEQFGLSSLQYVQDFYWLCVYKYRPSGRLHRYVRVRLIAHQMGSVSLCRIIKPLFKIADTSNSLALKHR